ncbi:MAG: hypothetical protein ABSC51_12450 [Gaiellaceae bacterium]
MLIIDDDIARKLLDMSAAIEPIRRSCLRLDDAPECRFRIVFDDPGSDARGLLLGGYLADQGAVCMKLVGDFAEGSGGFVINYDTRSASICCLYTGNYLTDFRTGAVSGVATDALARPDSTAMAIIGTGRQSITQFAAMCAVRNICTVAVWNRTPAHAERWIADRLRECSGSHLQFVLAPTPKAACKDADIVVTSTAADAPVLEDIAWLAPGTHVNAVGAGSPVQRELGRSVLREAQVVALDSLVDGVQVGDFGPMAADTEDRAWPLVSLADLLSGRRSGRVSASDITVFKSVGHPANDAAVLALLADLVMSDRTKEKT